MIVLGIKGSGHDTGAAIVGDDAGTLRIIAISEEIGSTPLPRVIRYFHT